MRIFISGLIAVLLSGLASPGAFAQNPIPRAVERQTVHIVKLEVKGERYGSNTGTITKNGTGFYVSSLGFILTAGHVLSPTRPGEQSVKIWDDDSPRIRVTHPGGEGLSEQGALIYYDEQVDLGLLKVDSRRSKGALKLGVYADLRPNEEIYALAFGLRRGTEVVIRDGRVDTAAGLGSNGRARISIADLYQSDSGSPIVNPDGRVIAVLSHGNPSSNTGTVAIPIPFAAPMLARVEIRNAEEEDRINAVNSVVEEMRTEVKNFDAAINVNRTTSSLVITFEKRLESGKSPRRMDVDIALKLRGRHIPFTLGTFPAEVSALNTRGQQAIASGIIEKIMDRIDGINEASEPDDKINITKLESLLVTPTAVWQLVGAGGVKEKKVKGDTIDLEVKDPDIFR